MWRVVGFILYLFLGMGVVYRKRAFPIQAEKMEGRIISHDHSLIINHTMPFSNFLSSISFKMSGKSFLRYSDTLSSFVFVSR